MDRRDRRKPIVFNFSTYCSSCRTELLSFFQSFQKKFMGSQKNLVFAVVLENWRNLVPILMKLKNWIKITDPEAYDWNEIVAIEHELLRGFDLTKLLLLKDSKKF